MKAEARGHETAGNLILYGKGSLNPIMSLDMLIHVEKMMKIIYFSMYSATG